MKKKIIIILTTLCLILASAAFAENVGGKPYWEDHPGVLAFDSYWVSGDAQVRMRGSHTGGGYEMQVVEMTGISRATLARERRRREAE